MPKTKPKTRRCPDCGCKEGEFHTSGCDVEQCAECGLQRLGCDCRTSKRIPWTGDRGDVLDAIRIGWYSKFVPGGWVPGGWVSCDKNDPDGHPDINRVLAKCVWNKRKLRWEPKKEKE